MAPLELDASAHLIVCRRRQRFKGCGKLQQLRSGARSDGSGVGSATTYILQPPYHYGNAITMP
uniref:Uncharacterized protein n=1 Tax=Oryza meridionalis TaxID=40149 RepID=A0A0E0C794_9ORYZ